MRETATCDLCHTQNLDEYVDGKTAMGPWALMCIPCFKIAGVGLGLGKGQMFRLSIDGKEWVNVTKFQTAYFIK